jgi:crotonobetainyl-CoA:carnitine CoA-transferase CaiB-like acyl-CoA transferase
MNQPLRGLRVLDFGQGVAGPYCGQLLGDHGADVIKIEPPRGDWSRTMGAANDTGLGGTFISVNRNKRGLCLDLKQAEAIEIARHLANRADVVVESFRPGVLDRLGLGYEALSKANPGLVYCTVTGFGESGPNVDLPAGDSIMQAYGGLMSIVGERDGQPLRIGNVVSDMVAGTNAFSGCVLALLMRTRDGKGRKVGVSLLDSIVAFQGPPLTEYLLTGEAPQRLGNQHPLIAPSGTMKASDGSFSFTVLDHQWPAFCDGIGVTPLKADPRFADSASRQRNRDALDKALSQVFETRTAAEWVSMLQALDILCAPINEYPALVRDPQVVHNGLIETTTSGKGSSLPMLRNPVRLHDGATTYAPPPALGEHTRDILAHELDYDTLTIDDLLARRVALASPRTVTQAV